MFVSRQEDNARQSFLGQRAENLKTVHARHLYIEEDEVGQKLEDLRHRGQTVWAFAHDLDIRALPQSHTNTAAGEWLVIDNQHTHDVLPGASAAFRKGSSTVTSQPPASGHCKAKV